MSATPEHPMESTSETADINEAEPDALTAACLAQVRHWSVPGWEEAEQTEVHGRPGIDVVDGCTLTIPFDSTGSAEVWRASRGEHLKVIKIVWPNAPRELHSALKREADILQYLRDLDVTGIVDYESHGELVMESDAAIASSGQFLRTAFFPGRHIRSLDHDRDPNSLNLLLKAIVEVGRTLAKLHVAGVIHRDIKPENILFRCEDDQVRVRLLDFGAACRIGQGRLAEVIDASRFATPDYVSPEMHDAILDPAMASQVDHRSDLWQLGRLLQFSLDRRRRYGDRTASTRALFRVVRRATEEKPEDRYCDADAFADALESARNVIRRRRSAVRILRSRPVVLGLTSVLAILLLTLWNNRWQVLEVPAVVNYKIQSNSPTARFGHSTIITSSGELRLTNLRHVELQPDALIVVAGKASFQGAKGWECTFRPQERSAKWRGIHVVGPTASLNLQSLRLEGGTSYKLDDSEAKTIEALIPQEQSSIAFLRSDRRGGLLSVTDGHAMAVDVEFVDGHAKMGGAIFSRSHGLSSPAPPRLLELDQCRFLNNESAGHDEKQSGGGGIFLWGHQRAGLRLCDFVSNRTVDSTGSGGALYLGRNALADISNCTFTGNRARGDGGAVYALNTHKDDVPGAPENPTLITTCHFVRNWAVLKGGALAVQNRAFVRVVETEFTDNVASDGGGIQYGVDPTVTDILKAYPGALADACFFKGNLASLRGSDISTVAVTIPKDCGPAFSNCRFIPDEVGSLAARVNIQLLDAHEPSESLAVRLLPGASALDHISFESGEAPRLSFIDQPDETTCQSAALAMLLNWCAVPELLSAGKAVWDASSVRKALGPTPSFHTTWTQFLHKQTRAEWQMVYEPDKTRAIKIIRDMIAVARMPVLMSVGFTPSGHVILVTGYRDRTDGFELIALDPNGQFDPKRGFGTDRKAGMTSVYPFDLCQVRVQYMNDDTQTLYSKIPILGKPLAWMPCAPHAPGEFSDWEMMVHESAVPSPK